MKILNEGINCILHVVALFTLQNFLNGKPKRNIAPEQDGLVIVK